MWLENKQLLPCHLRYFSKFKSVQTIFMCISDLPLACYIRDHSHLLHFTTLKIFDEAWGGVVVKALRYYSDGPGIDSRGCHWIFQ